jgi:hypothetical protein
MNTKSYNRSNFHQHTFCVFQEVEVAAIANLKTDYKSKSGSSYYFTNEGVYRLSNHWGRAANCKWRLESANSNTTSRIKVGFANWNAFHPDNDLEKLYFISVNFEKKAVTYLHKNSTEYDGKAFLRTASETTAIIKSIRNLLTTEAWAKHYEVDLETLRKNIVMKLITTNLSLQEIKRAALQSLS